MRERGESHWGPRSWRCFSGVGRMSGAEAPQVESAGSETFSTASSSSGRTRDKSTCTPTPSRSWRTTTINSSTVVPSSFSQPASLIGTGGSCAQKRFRCAVCQSRHDSWNQLIAHQNHYKHGVNPRPSYKFNCQICEKRFATRTHLLDHFTHYHFPQSLFSCPHCDQVFPKSSALKAHVSVSFLYFSFFLYWYDPPSVSSFYCFTHVACVYTSFPFAMVLETIDKN